MGQINKNWENPQLQHKNRMEGRTYFIPFANEEDYREGREKNMLSLNGNWRFLYLQAPEYSPKGFNNPDFPLEAFNTIRVPSCWQLEGYGQMRYVDELYPFHVNPPFVPVDNPTGIYKRKFTLDDGWSGDRVILRFHGVDSYFEVWVNGHEIGMGKISRLLSEFDVTDAVMKGENEITVRVIQWSDGSYLEDQDMWWFSGIFRDVELIRQPKVHIQDVTVETDLNQERNHCTLTAKVWVGGTEHDGEAILSVALLDDKNQEIGKFLQQSAEIHPGEIEYTLRYELDQPRLWSAEAPNLYVTALTLEGAEFVAVETGVRCIAVRGNQFLVNGKAIMLNGINRHDANCITGRTVSKEDMLWDVLTMKRHNINAVRTSHYPNHPYFYHLCNQYGLYVIDETDLECHGFMDIGYWNWLSNSKEWTGAYVARGTGMVKRDRNHPCILMWSLGNESGFGYNFTQMAAAIRALDTSRLIHYEGDFNGAVTDVYSTMYSRMPGLNTIGGRNEEMPFIICEYCHAMGNGPGALKEHQELFHRYDRMQGGFIWEWIDHGIQCLDENGKLFYQYGGDYGDFPNNANFCMDGMVFPWREPSPALLEYKKVIQPVEILLYSTEPTIITLKNKYDFIDLSHLRLEWTCTANGVVLARGQADSLQSISPGESRELAVPIACARKLPNTEYRLAVEITAKEALPWAEKGHRIAWEDMLLQPAVPNACPRPVGGRLKVAEQPMRLTVAGDGFEVVFDTLHGCLESTCNHGKKQISEGIKINFWRAPIDNDMYVADDRKNKYMMHLFESCPHRFCYEEKENRVEVEILQRVAPVSQAYGYDVTWNYTIFSSGDISLKVDGRRVHTDKNAPEDLPKIGLEVIMAPENDRITWYGRGPGENYIDSKAACSVGLHTLPVSAMHTPYPFPQENGNRSDVRWAAVSAGENSLIFLGKEPFDLTAHDYTKEQLDAAKHLNELKTGGKTVLSLDYRNSGLGSNSCGQGPLEEHKARFLDFNFALELRSCRSENEQGQLAAACYDGQFSI